MIRNPSRHPDGRRLPAATEFAAIGITVATNVVANRFLPPEAYVPANLASAGVISWFATRTGATRADFGLQRGSVKPGLITGIKYAVPIAATVVAAATIPGLQRFFASEQVLAGGGTAYLLYETLVRIPIGTALSEEIIFRGALLGMFRRRYSSLGATALSSLLFGLWHVLPTLNDMQTNGTGEVGGGTAWAHAGVVAGVVGVTTAAGFGFEWLRDRKNSTVTPIVVHAAINTAAYLSGRYLLRTI